MYPKCLMVAAAGLLAISLGTVAVAQNAVVRAADAAYAQPVVGSGAIAASPVVAGPDVVVTYANNRSSVVVTGQQFGIGRRVGETAPANPRNQ